MGDSAKPLVVYYSRTGKTRLVAGKVAELLGGDLVEIREAKDRSGLRGWLGAGRDTLGDRPTCRMWPGGSSSCWVRRSGRTGPHSRSGSFSGVWISPRPASRRSAHTAGAAGPGPSPN